VEAARGGQHVSRRAALAIGCLLALALPAVARATDATGAQVRTLARRAAAGDGSALERLRQIDRVDNVPVALRRVLAVQDPASRRARLRQLAAQGARPSVGNAQARSEAQKIVAESRFKTKAAKQSSALHRPTFLHRATRALGKALRRLFGTGGGGAAPGWFVWLAWGIALALVGLALWAIGRSLATWKRTPKHKRAVPTYDAPSSSADELLRLADEAERDGQLEQALRLRFRAGLRRLQERRLVPWRDSLTSREVSRKLRLADFDALARTFDEVAYGRRAPVPEDVVRAREAWPQVLEQAGRP
jgi:hypothetical protein